MFKIEIEYPTSSRNTPRYTSQNQNSYIVDALKKNSAKYIETLNKFQKYFPQLSKIQVSSEKESIEPTYINGWMPGLDSVLLYSMLAEYKPKKYLEVGSGHSTKFARKSITDNGLSTEIISIDPYPRALIDQICDQVIRQPLEDIDLSIFDSLDANDIVYIDNSHRTFMNSDVTVSFLDIMPRLKPGVFLHFHDICWPLDYPADWAKRYYNEQYILGALLANGLTNYEVLLPNYWLSANKEFSTIIDPLWDSDQKFKTVEKHGCGFWMVKNS